jgi:hypothetical protein
MRKLSLILGIVAIGLLLASCGDEPVLLEPTEVEGVDPSLRAAHRAWVDFEDKGDDPVKRELALEFNDYLRALRGPTVLDPEAPAVKNFQHRTAWQTLQAFGIAGRIFEVPPCPGSDPNCQERRGFGYEGYYDPADGAAFTGIDQNPYHDWALWGNTDPEHLWEDPQGRLHWRGAGIAMNAMGSELEEHPRLFMANFTRPFNQPGEFTHYKIDNRPMDGWLMMDGTLPSEITVVYDVL